MKKNEIGNFQSKEEQVKELLADSLAILGMPEKR